MRPIEEQTVLVTGATGGLGEALVMGLADRGATVIAHGRDEEKLADLVETASRSATGSVEPVTADLADLVQVRELADTVLERHEHLHTLVNNAGVGFGPPDGPRQVSKDGAELRFAVNHLASYALAKRLSRRLRDSAPARIVQVASAGQVALDPEDPFTEKDYDGITAYRRSKLAQVMATIDLADSLADTGVTVNAIHPATFMDTAMVREHGQRPVSTVEEGTRAVLRLILDPDLDDVTGRYFDGTEPAAPDRQALDPAVRRWVRTVSDDLLARSGA